VLDRGITIKGSDGLPTRMVGTHTDVSSLKETEEQLRRSNRDLEQFAYAASHDLQEPLRMINGWTTALFEDHGHLITTEEGKQSLYYITDGVTRMRRLIQDLLRFSKAGRDLALAPVVPVRCVSSAVKNLATLIAETGARVDCNEPMPMVRADAAMLSQVFQNLISNSLKFRRKDVAPEITIRGVQQGSLVRITVADNGIGIDPKYVSKVFEVFTRLYSTAEYDGTGIGLALARRIVHAHGGDIGIDSPGADQGTTVWFTLRVAGAT
jgi:light-regulated signal transduction histidine kinase (bacteriophytochrome)